MQVLTLLALHQHLATVAQMRTSCPANSIVSVQGDECIFAVQGKKCSDTWPGAKIMTVTANVDQTLSRRFFHPEGVRDFLDEASALYYGLLRDGSSGNGVVFKSSREDNNPKVSGKCRFVRLFLGTCNLTATCIVLLKAEHAMKSNAKPTVLVIFDALQNVFTINDEYGRSKSVANLLVICKGKRRSPFQGLADKKQALFLDEQQSESRSNCPPKILYICTCITYTHNIHVMLCRMIHTCLISAAVQIVAPGGATAAPLPFTAHLQDQLKQACGGDKFGPHTLSSSGQCANPSWALVDLKKAGGGQFCGLSDGKLVCADVGGRCAAYDP